MTITTSGNTKAIKSKITRLKNKLKQEQEKRTALLGEREQIGKMEKMAVAQNDKVSLAKIWKKITGI